MIAMVRNLTGFVACRFVKQCVIRSVLDRFIVGSLLFCSCRKHGCECKFLVLSGHNALNVTLVSLINNALSDFSVHQVHFILNWLLVFFNISVGSSFFYGFNLM